MLLTICPNCSAQFKVQPEQLNVRQGRVKCGRCREVFNAFQSLSRVEESVDSEVAKLPDMDVELAEVDVNPLIPLETDGGTEIAADPIFSRAEPPPLPAAFFATASLAVVSEASSHSPAILPLPTNIVAAIAAETPLSEPPALAPAISAFQDFDSVPAESAIKLSDEENPLLAVVPASRRKIDAAPSRAWSVGALLLFVTLLVAAIYTLRTTLVSSYPQLRPALSQVCDFAGCTISWGRDDSAFEIVTSELVETPTKPGRILLTATVVNRSKTKQDFPSLELRLTDNANQIVVSRALHPLDYLGRTLAKDEGLAPGAEVYVNLNLEVGNKSLASGYGLLPFFP